MAKAARTGGQSAKTAHGSKPSPSADGDRDPTESPEPADVADYVASLAAELAAMARGAKLNFVAHLLEIARLAATEAEADARSRKRGAIDG